MASQRFPQTPYYNINIYLCVGLQIITLGLFEYYWHYKNWRIIERNTATPKLPLLRAVLYPFFIFALVNQLKGSCEVTGVKKGFTATFIFSILYFLVVIFRYDAEDELLWLFFLLTALPLGMLQLKMQEVNKAVAVPPNATGIIRLPSGIDHPAQLLSEGRLDYIRQREPSSRFMIGFFAALFVWLYANHAALEDFRYIKTKAQFTEVLMLAGDMKTQIAEVYSMTGSLNSTMVENLVPLTPNSGSGSTYVSEISNYGKGNFVVHLNSSQFNGGDALGFRVVEKGEGPFRMVSLVCSPANFIYKTDFPLSPEFLPNTCRWPE